MYVNLYPRKSLEATRRSLVLVGAFLALGGGYALLREFLWMPAFREGWALASAVLILAGGVLLALGTNLIRLQDAFFSMTPNRIAFRVSPVGRQQVIQWEEVSCLNFTESLIIFKLNCGRLLHLRLEAIQQPEIARHVSRSLHLAAMEKGLAINSSKSTYLKPTLQV